MQNISKTQQLAELDLRYIWHPCTQMKDHENFPIIPIKRAKGIYLEDFDGNIYIDAISSWWVNILGHSNASINKAIKKQLDDFEHIILAGYTHKPAIELAKKLVEISPDGLEKVFFADNGSSGIEVALKMSYHFFKNQGQIRPIFVSLENSYHGETMGALAVSDVGIYKEAYNELLLKSVQVYAPKNKSTEETQKALKNLEELLENRSCEITAVIIEPLVQCAGSMMMYSEKYLRGVRELTEKHGIFLIADEVAVGFGRTGTLFACEQADISPDLMVLSKGLTGGYLPLSVVLCSQKIYNAFYCDYNPVRTFLHSHSYTGNALACTAALASIEYLKKHQIIKKNKTKIKFMASQLSRFDGLKIVKNTRQTGMICAIELNGFEDVRIGLKIAQMARNRGVLLRPLGNVIYLMPPYIITKKEIKYLFDSIWGILEELAISQH